MSLYFVFLRRPKSLADRRDDPFWEFASFGTTGCHSSNLLHPRCTWLKDGDRLAFLQGGVGEIRIVAVTPDIKVGGSTERIEVRWAASYRPLPYAAAPVLIDNSGVTAFPAVFSELRLDDTYRTTPCGKVASRLRARKRAVGARLSTEILQWFGANDLPRIGLYPEAIEPTDGTWYRHAVNEGWANVARRRKEYKGTLQPVPARNRCAPAPRRAMRRSRRCC